MSQRYFLGVLDLSKEVLWTSVDQMAEKLQAVKVGGLRKNSAATHHMLAVLVRVLDNGIIHKV